MWPFYADRSPMSSRILLLAAGVNEVTRAQITYNVSLMFELCSHAGGLATEETAHAFVTKYDSWRKISVVRHLNLHARLALPLPVLVACLLQRIYFA